METGQQLGIFKKQRDRMPVKYPGCGPGALSVLVIAAFMWVTYDNLHEVPTT